MRKSIRGGSAAVAASILVLLTWATPEHAIPAPAAPVGNVVAAPRPPAPTSWRALNNAIAAIPNYRKGVATWVAGNPYGHYGTTNLRTRRIYISRSVPSSRLFSVVVHEYAHALSVANYAGNLRRLDTRLARYFRAGKTMNREYSADCMARLMGATWTHHTRCVDRRWRSAATTLLRGARI